MPMMRRAGQRDRRRHRLAARAGADDGFDAIVGEIDYSDVDVPALLAEREEYKGIAQRVQADFDNYRKRSAAQSLAEADRASGRLAEALLPVLDAAEAAFLRHPDEVGPLLNQMLVELKKHGLEIVDLEGQPFDPEFAEAVAHEPGDGGEPWCRTCCAAATPGRAESCVLPWSGPGTERRRRAGGV